MREGEASGEIRSSSIRSPCSALSASSSLPSLDVTREGPRLRAGEDMDMLMDWLVLVMDLLSTEAASLSSSSKSNPSAYVCTLRPCFA